MAMPNSIGATMEYAKLMFATMNQTLMSSTMNALKWNRQHPRTIGTRSCQSTRPTPIWRPENCCQNRNLMRSSACAAAQCLNGTYANQIEAIAGYLETVVSHIDRVLVFTERCIVGGKAV